VECIQWEVALPAFGIKFTETLWFLFLRIKGVGSNRQKVLPFLQWLGLPSLFFDDDGFAVQASFRFRSSHPGKGMTWEKVSIYTIIPHENVRFPYRHG